MATNPYASQKWRTLRKQLLTPETPCHWCGKPATELDHLIELDAGGDMYDPANLVPSCKPCNSRRGARYVNQKTAARVNARRNLTTERAQQQNRNANDLKHFFTTKPQTPSPPIFSIADGLASSGQLALVPDSSLHLGEDLPRLETPPHAGIGRGADIAAWGARVLNRDLMGWQLHALDRIFCDVEGSWAAPTALISVGRQNGKTTLMENAIGWLLTDYAQEVGRPISVLSTAHELDLAVESFLELADVLKELYGAKVTYAYGRNQVLMPDGSLWKVKASTGKKHGGTWDFIFADEIWALSEAALFGALKPSQIAVPNPLMVLLSTAGDESSTAFLQLREQALSAIEKGEPTDLTMLEWSVPPGCGIEEQFWGMANPALGTTITMQGLRSAFNGPDKTAFARAHLNQWVSAAGSWLGPGLWDSLQTDQPMPAGGVLAVDCSIDNSRYVGVRASSENGIVHLAVEFTTASESEMWQEVTRVMRSSSTVVLGITPALAIHIPKEFVRRNKLWGYKEILTFTGLVRNMIVEERVRHRGETILAEHVNRAVMTKTVQGAVLSSQKSPGPIELTRAMVYAVAMASKSQAPKPFVAVAGG